MSATDVQVKEAELPARLQMDEERYRVLRSVVAPEATPAELMAFVSWCKVRGLDPTAGQAHFSKIGGETQFLVGIEGMRLLAAETGVYFPGRPATFELDDAGRPVSATAYVMARRDDGEWFEIAETVYLEEAIQVKRDGTPTRFWIRMPRRMLAKCAEAAALRRAFPKRLARIYTPDEMPEPVPAPALGDAEKDPRVLASMKEKDAKAAALSRLLGIMNPRITQDNLSGEQRRQARADLVAWACAHGGPPLLEDLKKYSADQLLQIGDVLEAHFEEAVAEVYERLQGDEPAEMVLQAEVIETA